MQYSRKKFVAALALGRGVRFTIVAGLGAIYGRHIVRFFSQYYKPALFILIGLGGIGRELLRWSNITGIRTGLTVAVTVASQQAGVTASS